MKTTTAAALIAVATLLTTACEQHKWSDTKKLFPEEHEAAEHGEHKDGGHKEGEHKEAGHTAETPAGEHKAAEAAAPAEAKH